MQRPLLVGEFEFTLDAKNRIAVPARLRSAFAEGIYVTQENERCLGGYSPEEFQRRLEEDVEASRRARRQRRDVKRRLAANAVYFPELDRQGRVTLPGQAPRVRRHQQGRQRHRRRRPRGDLGPRRLDGVPGPP